MKKIILPALILTAALLLTSCNGQKYRLIFDNCEGSFSGARASYKKGQTVKLKFDTIATDTDYTFYVDDEYFRPDYKDNCFILEFPMPDHDVTISFSSHNSMMSAFAGWSIYSMTDEVPEGTFGAVFKDYEGSQVTLTLINHTEEPQYYGLAYGLQKEINGTYTDIVLEDPPVFDEIAYELEPGASADMIIDLSPYKDADGDAPLGLTEGYYRICLGEKLTAEFIVEAVYTE